MTHNHTPGPWTGHNMVHADTGEAMSPEQIGEYVCNSVKMGDPDRFLFISAPHPDGGIVDIAHFGNGPRGAENMRRVIAMFQACDGIPTAALEGRVVADMLEALRGLERALLQFMDDPSRADEMPAVIATRAAIARATGAA